MSAIWGTTPGSGAYYMPVGLHHGSGGVGNFGLLGGTFKTVFGMTFSNSYHDRTWSLGIQRDVYHVSRISLGYGAGIMYGYHGRLSESHHLPLQDSFLFTHALNPVLGIAAHVDVTEHVQIESFITPVVTLAGVKFAFR